MNPNLKELTSLYDYIVQYYGQPIYSYQWGEDEQMIKEFELDWGIQEIIEETDADDDNSSSEKPALQVQDEYTDLGLVYCYTCGLRDDDSPRIVNGTYHLFVKSYDGDKYYYVGADYNGSTKYPVTKGSWTKSGERFNGRVDGGGSKWYLNVSAWPAAGSGSSSGGSGGGTVVIEHSGPRQEWVQCTGCNGSGKCQNCNGTGRNLYSTHDAECVGCGGWGRCGFCAGQGGHYETRY